MTYKSVDDNSLAALANKIREKANIQDTLSVPDGMITAINSIVRTVPLYKVVFGYIAYQKNRKELTVTGLNFKPIGAIFICTNGSSVYSNYKEIISITNFDNNTGIYGYGRRNYYPITTNQVILGNNSVAITNPIVKDGNTDIAAELNGDYTYVIWGK